MGGAGPSRSRNVFNYLYVHSYKKHVDMGKKPAAEERRTGIAHAPTLKAEQTGCTEAVCGVVESCEPASKAKWMKVAVNIGDEAPVTLASNFDGLDIGSRVVVAVVGSFVGDVEVLAQERAGVLSHGLLCDSAMLGWCVPLACAGTHRAPRTAHRPPPPRGPGPSGDDCISGKLLNPVTPSARY